MRYCDWLHSRIADFIPLISYRLAMYGLRYMCTLRGQASRYGAFLLSVAGEGVEPSIPEPRSGVLPLHYPAVCDYFVK